MVRMAAGIALASAVFASGCGDQGNWPDADRSDSRPIRPSPPSPVVVTTQPVTPVQTATAAPRGQPLGGQTDLIRVDLQSPLPRDASDELPGRVVLRHVAARPCARVLEMLYPPLASGGSQDRYYLIYQDRASADAAAGCVAMLDRPPATHKGAEAELDRGVRALMDLAAQVVPPESRELTACLENLRQAMRSDGRTGWAAAMLAGRVEMEFRFKADAAREAFDIAEKKATAGSVEQMIALCAQAESCDMAGDAAGRRAVSERIVKSFSRHRTSHLYQRAESWLESGKPGR